MNIIVAKCLNGGIGYKNKLPWGFRSDLRRFAELTKGQGNNAIIMGRKTWESLPLRPLSGRDNYVLSTTLRSDKAAVFPSVETLMSHLQDKDYDDIWVIGGAAVYEALMDETDKLYVTEIQNSYCCDTFFPSIPDAFTLESSVERWTTADSKTEDVLLRYAVYTRT